ncbi:hypothetical protein B0H11DRAFT_2221186 [Mycena galericulata]|nr:hypothetical protein B0H11DRAFT_2221186 [Mycena galericulata]
MASSALFGTILTNLLPNLQRPGQQKQPMSMDASPPPLPPPHSHYYGYPGYDVYAPAPVRYVYWAGTGAGDDGAQGQQGSSEGGQGQRWLEGRFCQ